MSDSEENIRADNTTKVGDSKKSTKSTEKSEENITSINTTNKKVETKYLLNDLIDNCKALGYKKEIVAGAFFNCNIREMTKQEFQEQIKNFLRKRVK